MTKENALKLKLESALQRDHVITDLRSALANNNPEKTTQAILILATTHMNDPQAEKVLRATLTALSKRATPHFFANNDKTHAHAQDLLIACITWLHKAPDCIVKDAFVQTLQTSMNTMAQRQTNGNNSMIKELLDIIFIEALRPTDTINLSPENTYILHTAFVAAMANLNSTSARTSAFHHIRQSNYQNALRTMNQSLKDELDIWMLKVERESLVLATPKSFIKRLPKLVKI